MILQRPLLAAKTTEEDLKNLRYPVMLSPKIDGIRALVNDGKLVSRTLKPIRNKYTQTLFGQHGLNGLDGELVVGNPFDKNLMQATSSGVMSEAGTPLVTYYVFDRWDVNRTFHERFNAARYMIEQHTHLPIKLVEHQLVHDYSFLKYWEEHYLDMGFEGVMLRAIHGRYKQNRSTLREGILLKVKRFEDGEAEILGFEPLYRNTNEQTRDERGYAKRSHHAEGKVADECLGSFNVRDLETGQVFDVGSGFTQTQRETFWFEREVLKGEVIKYKKFVASGEKDKPRFPIFVGFRHKDDR